MPSVVGEKEKDLDICRWGHVSSTSSLAGRGVDTGSCCRLITQYACAHVEPVWVNAPVTWPGRPFSHAWLTLMDFDAVRWWWWWWCAVAATVLSRDHAHRKCWTIRWPDKLEFHGSSFLVAFPWYPREDVAPVGRVDEDVTRMPRVNFCRGISAIPSTRVPFDTCCGASWRDNRSPLWTYRRYMSTLVVSWHLN